MVCDDDADDEYPTEYRSIILCIYGICSLTSLCSERNASFWISLLHNNNNNNNKTRVEQQKSNKIHYWLTFLCKKLNKKKLHKLLQHNVCIRIVHIHREKKRKTRI